METNKIISCILFTAGMDSTVAAHYSKNVLGYETVALTLKQNDLNKKEVEYSKKMTKFLGIKHFIYDITNYSNFIQHTVTNSCGYKEGNKKDIEENFIENRNAIFALIAHSLVQKIMKEGDFKNGKVMLGLLSIDPEYPDSNFRFFQSLSDSLNIGVLHGNVDIQVPLYDYSKEDIYNYLIENDIPLKLTWSCNTNNEIPCGECFGCTQRNKLNRELNIKI
jgi:7-cyano-7-deazaguanine synthase